MIQLSVCIPTFNRAHYLKSALESIFAQKAACSDEVEVIVCDNASPDNTRQTVEAFAKQHHNLKYFQNPSNIGFDGNMLKVFSMARGKYCIVLGDDDIFNEGALAYILEKIKTDCALYVTGMVLSDDKMNFMEPLNYLKNIEDETIFDIGDKQDILRYLKAVRSNSGLFGHIGGFIVKRELWEQVPVVQRVMGLQWIHVYKLWSLWHLGGKLQVLLHPVINIRTHNDETIKQSGQSARLLMEFKAMYIIAGTVFAEDSDIYNAFLKTVKNYSPLYTIPPLFAVPEKEKEIFYELTDYLCLYPYPVHIKVAFTCPLRLSPLYFLRIILNKSSFRLIKKPFKFIKDLF